MLTVIIILLLWIGVCSLVHRITRGSIIKLSLYQLLLFLAGKILAGAVYGYLFKRFYNGDDTWGLHHDSIVQYQRLLHTPGVFFHDLISTRPVPLTGEFYFKSGDYLVDLEFAFTTKTLALFNLLSHGNYYINMALFNVVGFWGVYFLYKLVAERLNEGARPLTAAVLFLFPPTLFWLSGIRTEGLLLLFTGILLYRFSKWLAQKKWVDALICFICFGMSFLLRNGFALVLLPALLAWWMSARYSISSIKAFGYTYALCAALVVTASLVLPVQWNALQVIAARQHEFMELKGNTRFMLTRLESNPLSFLKVLPEAVINTALRPAVWEARGLLQWFAAVENILVALLAVATVWVWLRERPVLRAAPVGWALLLAALGNYIIIGYICPFPGAIVRYKIIPELFLISACLLLLCQSRHLFRQP
jgi:Dolichyl-phosphate-mannose-protein mannosyltransferase